MSVDDVVEYRLLLKVEFYSGRTPGGYAMRRGTLQDKLEDVPDSKLVKMSFEEIKARFQKVGMTYPGEEQAGNYRRNDKKSHTSRQR